MNRRLFGLATLGTKRRAQSWGALDRQQFGSFREGPGSDQGRAAGERVWCAYRLNLAAIRLLLPEAKLSAVEINETAVTDLRKMRELTVYHRSILDFSPEDTHDLVLTKGPNSPDPDELPGVYDLLYRSSSRYICVAEYYNPTPVTVRYRGHTEKLFKRDFAGEMLDRFDDLMLVH